METRDKRFLLAAPEARVLTAIARRLPRWIKPDHLTALGVLAALGIAAAYVLSNGDELRRAAALRVLPRPPRRRLRDSRDRHRTGPVAVHAAGGRTGDRGR